MESLERQKADAKRWLVRQQVRLQAQAEEVNREKRVIADMLSAELVALANNGDAHVHR